MAARLLLIVAAIAAAVVLIFQVPAKTSTSILDQLPSFHRTLSNETDADADADDVFDDVERSDEQRDLATTSSSDNIFAHQQRSSGYGYGYGYTSSPYTNNYWTNTGGYTKGYTVYNQQHQQKYSSGGYKYPTGSYQTGYKYPSYPTYTYNTGRYPVARPKPGPSSFGRIKKWNGGRKKSKKQSCYVKCCRKMRGRRNKKKKCRRRCRKKNNRPKNPCNMHPCPKYPCGTNPCPKKSCPGETITTCARICSPDDGCAFFGFVLGSIQCNLWTAYCEPICQLGRGPPTPLPPTPAPPTPRPPTLPISSRTCQCNTPLRERRLQESVEEVTIVIDDPGINLIGKLLTAEEVEDFQIEPDCNSVFFYAPPDQEDDPGAPPPAPPPTAPPGLVATPIQKYLIPLRENILFQTFDTINSASEAPVRTLVSIAIAADKTVVWWDHWEDGYDQNIQNPSNTTRIWGDGDPDNGCIKCQSTNQNSGRQCKPLEPADCRSQSINDVLEAGTSIVIENDVNLIKSTNNRDPKEYFFDGGDSLQASFPIAVSRAAFPFKDKSPNSLEAGAVEVADTDKWGRCFVAPVGRDLYESNSSPDPDPTNAFQETDIYLMASQPNTVVTVPSPASGQTIEVTLSLPNGTSSTKRITGSPSTSDRKFSVDVGQTIRIKNVYTGDEICANNPVQANLITGDRNSDFEMRWYSLLPKDQFSSDYFTPVTRRSGNGAASVYLFNPDPSNSITVIETLSNGNTRSHTVPAGKSLLVKLNDDDDKNSGHRFKANDDKPFFGMVLVDTSGGGQIVDWGVPLQPTDSLTAKAIIGLGYACTGGPRLGPDPTQITCHTSSGHESSILQPSPVWVSAIERAQYLVDYNCNGTVDKRFPGSGTNSAFRTVIITDAKDQDMSGACITAVDASGRPVKFAAVWGQDSTEDGSKPSELDMGILQFSLPELTVFKNCDLIVDTTCDGVISPSDTLLCSIRVTNTGGASIDQLTVTDPLPPGLSYESESGTVTRIDGSTTGLGSSYPLGGTGETYNQVGLDPGKSFQITYRATIDSFVEWSASGLQSLTGITTITGDGTQGTSSVTQTDTSQFSTAVTICDTLSAMPSRMPTSSPSKAPSRSPSKSPTNAPTKSPSASPSSTPSASPSAGPSDVPSASPSDSPSTPGPTNSPSHTPSRIPSALPSAVPSTSPSLEPSGSPSSAPSSEPSGDPSESPSNVPSKAPSMAPSALPSSNPSDQPSRDPSESPSDAPSKIPSSSPSLLPSSSPSSEPSRDPSESPSKIPSESPSLMPSASPSSNPSKSPEPSSLPSKMPSQHPTTAEPSARPSSQPSVSSMPSSDPSSMPSSEPSSSPSSSPSVSPSSPPSSSPSDMPSLTPSSSPSSEPSSSPSSQPSSLPSSSPSDVPSLTPSLAPSLEPSSSPSDEPSSEPSSSPSSQPSASPSAAPSLQPSSMPSRLPSLEPSSPPSSEPSSAPSIQPSSAPSAEPSSIPSAVPSASPSLAPSPVPSTSPSSMPSTSPSTGPSAPPSFRPSNIPSASPSSSPTDFPTFSPTTPEPTFSPTTAEPTPGPDPNTFCFMTYEVRTDPDLDTLVYAYEFQTELTECLFFRVFVGYFGEELFEACSGYVIGQGPNALTQIDSTSCRFAARFPPDSDLNVRIEYTALFTLPDAPPDQDRCSNPTPLSTCECEGGTCQELSALAEFPFEKFITEGICACNDCLV